MVNIETFQDRLGLTRNEALTAVGYAASQWNNNANSTFFSFAGDTWLESLEEDWGTNCEIAAGRNLVIADNSQPTCTAVLGQVQQRCGGTLWRLRLCTACSQCNWSFDPGPNERDILGTLVHEFGHAAGLNHPPSDQTCADVGSVMQGVADCIPYKLGRRELFPYDIRCLNSEVGYRSSRVYSYPLVAGSFGTSGQLSPSTAIKGHPVHRDASPTSFRSYIRRSNAQGEVAHLTYQGIPSGNPGSGFNVGIHAGVLPLAAWWREFPEKVRSYSIRSSDEASLTASNFVRQYIYTASDMGQLPSASWLRYCAGSVASCNPQYVKTSQRPAVAWNDYTQTTMMAWPNFVRQASSSDREIWISPNIHDVDILGLAYQTGLRSGVGPGLACAAFQAPGYYDCILAYVDPYDSHGRIRLRYFYITFAPTGNPSWYWSSEQQTLYLGPNSQGTQYPIALWRHDNKWWIAYVIAEGTFVRVLSSATGAAGSWDPIASLGYSATGPAVPSEFVGNTHVFVSR